MTTVLAEPEDTVLRPHAEQEYQAERRRWPRPTTDRGPRAGGCPPGR